MNTNTAARSDQIIPLDNTAAEHTAPRNRISRASQILRWVGGIMLAGAALSFAVQGWPQMDSLMKFHSFLAFTLVLCATGVYCGIRMGESKGARTLFGLAASFLPAHFVQLGGLIYYLTNGTPPGTPRMFVVQAPSGTSITMLLLLCLPTLLAVAFAGFSALARSEARLLTILYFAANAALLVPTRDADFIGIFGLFLCTALLMSEMFILSRNTTLQTLEGFAAKALVFVPVIVLFFRNLVLYQPTMLFVSAILTAITAASYLCARQLRSQPLIADTIEMFSFLLAAPAWFTFVSGTLFNQGFIFYQDFIQPIEKDLITPATFLPLAGIYALMSLGVRSSGTGYRRCASWLAIGTVLYQLFFLPSLVASFLCILTAGTILSIAFAKEDKGLFYSGSVGLAAGILYHLRYAAKLYSMSPWLTLAITGTLVVIISSHLESNAKAIVERTTALQRRIRRWS